jgi:hypothetical protein
MTMAQERWSVDVSDFPDLLHLAREVAESGAPRVLRDGDTELATISPVKKARKRAPRGRPLTREDPLFRLIGIGASEAESDASERKHEVLAQAYLKKPE